MRRPDATLDAATYIRVHAEGSSMAHSLTPLRALCLAACAIGQLGAGLPGNANDDPGQLREVVFGVYPYRGPVAVHSSLRPLIQRLSELIDQRVRLHVPPSYDKLIDRAVADWFDYVIAPPHLVGQLVTQHDHQPVAYSERPLEVVVFVTVESPVQELADLRGAVVITPSSFATATVVGMRILEDAGLRVERDVRYEHVEGHDHAILAVLEHQGDAGIVGRPHIEVMTPVLRDAIRIIHEVPSLPLLTILASPRISAREVEQAGEALKQLVGESDALRGALIKMNVAADRSTFLVAHDLSILYGATSPSSGPSATPGGAETR